MAATLTRVLIERKMFWYTIESAEVYAQHHERESRKENVNKLKVAKAN